MDKVTKIMNGLEVILTKYKASINPTEEMDKVELIELKNKFKEDQMKLFMSSNFRQLSDYEVKLVIDKMLSDIAYFISFAWTIDENVNTIFLKQLITRAKQIGVQVDNLQRTKRKESMCGIALKD